MAITLACLLLFPVAVSANLWINEIYPAPSSGDWEWVELYNDQIDALSLQSYTVTDLAGNKLKFDSATPLPGGGYTLASASSVLNNSGDTVFLKDPAGQTVDVATYSAGLTADQTVARCPDGNGIWQTVSLPTKNSSNAPACLALTPTATPIPSPTNPPPTVTATPADPTVPPPSATATPVDNIYLSEVMVNPDAGGPEWVELYNANPTSVTLNNWYIDDAENGGASPKSFTLTLNPQDYASFTLTSSMFNNDGDAVRLLDQNKTVRDSFEYQTTEKGLTIGRAAINDDNFCLMTPSRDQNNAACLRPTAAASSPAATSPKPSISQLPTAKPANPARAFPARPKTTTAPLVAGATVKPTTPPLVLGASDASSPDNTSLRLNRSLSLCSFTYAVLTIVSIFIKIGG